MNDDQSVADDRCGGSCSCLSCNKCAYGRNNFEALELIQENKFGKAKKLLKKIIALVPQSPESHYILGMCYQSSSNHRVEGLRAYLRAVELCDEVSERGVRARLGNLGKLRIAGIQRSHAAVCT